MIDILMKGPGEIIVGVIDRKGQVLMTKRLVLSGPDAIRARSDLPLTIESRNRQVAVVPVLMFASNEGQEVTFAGENAIDFTTRRCKELTIQPEIIEQAVKRAGEQRSDRGLVVNLNTKRRGT